MGEEWKKLYQTDVSVFKIFLTSSNEDETEKKIDIFIQ